MLKWPDKDLDELLDYTISWNARLGADTILSSTWITPTLVGSSLFTYGLTRATYSITTTRTVIWLSDGIEGSAYQMTNRITTAAGRIMDQSVKLKVRAK
jgi:hypothetical protein